MKMQLFKYLSCLGIYTLLIMLSACQNEPEGANRDSTVNIHFTGNFVYEDYIYTRADKVIFPLYSGLYDKPYYICMEYEDDNKFVKLPPMPYKVPSGYSGTLESENKEPLNWKTPKGKHTFWAWTLPWADNDISTEPTTIYFPNPDKSSSSNGDYENFFGSFNGPVNYDNNGEYVGLEFYHLVSKVIVEQIVVLFPSLTTYPLSNCEFTLVGISDQATFYPTPVDNEGNPIQPFVKSGDELTQITYNYTSSNGAVFYLPPETDFSKLQFEINITDNTFLANNPEYKYDHVFYGNFSAITFDRRGPNYDLGGPYDDIEGKSDLKILHAGEELRLYFTLSSGQTPGVGTNLQGWGLSNQETGTSHTRPGIYTTGEMNEYYDNRTNLEEYFNMWGQKTPDGEEVFFLYDNVTLNQNYLPTQAPYILDGMGHIIRMSPNGYGYIWVDNVRDIYITDGTNIIYIGNDNKVYKVDPVTFEKKYTGEFYAPKQTRIAMSSGDTLKTT